MRTIVKTLLMLVMSSFIVTNIFVTFNVAMAAEDSTTSDDNNIADAKVFFTAAVIAYKKDHNYDLAIQYADTAIIKGYDDAMVYEIRGMSYFERDKYTLALTDFNNALRRSPNDKNAYKWRGLAYIGKGELDKALADFHTAMSIDPTDEKLSSQVADVEKIIVKLDYTPENKFDDSKSKVISKVIQLMDSKNQDEAIDLLTKTLEKYPDSANLYKLRGMAYAETFNFDNAIEDFEAALKLVPDDKQSLKILANLKSVKYDHKLLED